VDIRFLLIQICFLLSGFSALLYQTAWTRQFAFVFGTSEIAVAVVLAGYMGGLALGSALAARIAPRIERPVLVYGLLELGIALSALALPFGMRGLTAAYVGLFSQQVPTEPELLATLFRLAGAFALMLVPTALMGATLPLLARQAVRKDEEIGPRIGSLYAINTAGAIAGTLVAAFLLLPTLGLRQTVYVGALVNGLVFLGAAMIARGARRPAALPEMPTATANRWILPLMLLSGAVSFSYEVLWTRLLSQLLGGSVYAFATMLSSFLLGIALGSALGGRFARRAERAALGFALSEIGVALFAILGFVLADWLPALATSLGAGWQASSAANAPIAGAVLLPVATCLGATFPFAVRLLASDPGHTAVATARVYAWNTVGAIAGAVGTGFWILPGLHFAGTATLGCALSLMIAAIASWRGRPRLRSTLAVSIGGLLALVVLPIENPWRLILATPLSGEQQERVIRYEAAGRSSTVVLLDNPSSFRLYTNGLPESTIRKTNAAPGGGREARALGWLPVALRPATERMLVIGLGGGVALEGVPPTVFELDVVELEEEVVAANLATSTERAVDPLGEERTRIVLNDARGALMLAEQPYDAIVSQPSHPWTAGASHLYTREFFELVRDRLAPGGVFVQWIGMRFVDEDLLRSLLATLSAVYPEVQVYRPSGPALLFVSSDSPLDVTQVAIAIAASPEHFARNGVFTAEDVAASQVLGSEGVRALAAGAPENTDDHNLLASRSPKLRADFLRLPQLMEMVEQHDPLRAPAEGLKGVDLTRALIRRRELARAEVVARSWEEQERDLALAWIKGQRQGAKASRLPVTRALERDPDSLDAHAAVLLAGLASPSPAREPASVALVRRALALERASDWGALEASDGELASIGPEHPLFDTASRLRSRWRTVGMDPVRAEEALALTDLRLAREFRLGLLIERAQTAAMAGHTRAAWATLSSALSQMPPRGPFRARFLVRVETIAGGLPDDPLQEQVLREIALSRGRVPS